MFALARELRLSRVSSAVAGICFAFGKGWWFTPIGPKCSRAPDPGRPVLFLFFLRAIRSSGVRRAALNAAFGGLCLALAILAGMLHMVIMQTLVVVSAAVFAGFNPRVQGAEPRMRPWVLPAVAAGGIALVAFCAGAIQLFPSMEYSAAPLPGRRLPARARP